MAGSAIEYLSRNPANTRITLGMIKKKRNDLFKILIIIRTADVSLEAAEKLAATGQNIYPVKLDVSDTVALDALVGRHSVVIWYVLFHILLVNYYCLLTVANHHL